jgi:tetratricopeptide (TPR) repeat protein
MQPLEQVARRLRGLIIKRPGMALGLWGEAGIGKTHCATQLLRESQCKNISLHATTALSNLARALPKPKTLPIWTTRILEKLELGKALSIEQTTSTFGTVLSGIAPFVLYLEDVHEASLERLEWIVAMAKVVTRLKGVALVVTSRSEPPEPFENIRLEKLDFEAVKSLLETEARSILPLEALEWIHGRAAGNPLFTLEFFRFLTRQGFVWTDGQKWRWRKPEQDAMPVTVEALLEQTLRDAANTPELEAVLGAKAVLGLECSDELWAEVAGFAPEVMQEAKLAFERKGVFWGDKFAHPLYAEIITRKLTSVERQKFSRQAIKKLQHSPQAAVKFIKDAHLESSEILELLRQAAESARDVGNILQALQYQAKSVEYANGEEKLQLALETAQGLRWTDIVQACRLAELAASVSGNTQAIGLFAELLAAQGQLEKATQVLEQIPPKEQTKIARLQLKIRSAAHGFSAVVQWWREHPSFVGETETDCIIAVALAMCGENDEAELIAVRVLAQPNLEPQYRYQLLSALGHIRYHTNKSGEALILYEQALEAARETQRNDIIAASLQSRAIAQGELGHRDEQIADLREAVKLHSEHSNYVQMTRSQVSLADALLDSGKYEQAELLLLEARNYLAQFQSSISLVECEYRLSQLYRDWGLAYTGMLALKFGRASVENAKQAKNSIKLAWSLCHAAISEARFGDVKRAEQFVSEALTLGTELKSFGLIGLARFAKALTFEALGERHSAIQTFRELERDLTEKGFTDPTQEVGLEIDRLTNDIRRAATRLEWFKHQGLYNLANITQRYFPQISSNNITQTQAVNLFRLELLGSLQITLENNPQPIRGKKRQELLVLLLEARIAGKSEVTRLELLDTLYPNEPEDRATSSLKELIRGTRSSLQPDAIETTTNGYALGNVSSDAEEFLTTNDSSLWRGTYLNGMMLEHGFDSVRESLSLALFNAAKSQLETNPREAARVSRILLEMNPYDLEVLQLSIQAFQACENYKTLGRVYTDARERLADVGETLPERWQDFLETSIPA